MKFFDQGYLYKLIILLIFVLVFIYDEFLVLCKFLTSFENLRLKF